MKIFRSSNFPETSEELYWLYNGLDCTVTLEVHNVLETDMEWAPPEIKETYHMSMRKSAPYMLMSLRGIRVDEMRRQKALFNLAKDHRIISRNFDRLCMGTVGEVVNPASWAQVGTLLYGHLGLPGSHLGTGKNQLNKLTGRTIARPFIKHILALRDINKQRGALNATLENERFHSLLSVAGTKTGRLSARKSNFGVGGNAQNIDSRHRGMFIPDPGFVAVEIDLEQADSRNIGAICHKILRNSSYLDFCEGGDLHTAIAKMVWPELPWPGWGARKYAETMGVDGQPQDNFQFTLRQIAKKSGHGTNFLGGPQEIATQVNLPTHTVEAFQRRYYDALPVIPNWHQVTARLLEDEGVITTIFGRRREFHGRPDKQTLKQALAYQASSMTAHEIDHGVLAIYNEFEGDDVQLLNQVHDSVWFQIRESLVDLLLPEIMGKMELHTDIGDRNFFVPLEASCGESFAKDKMEKFKVAA